MRLCLSLLLAVTMLRAADDPQLSVALHAQSDFDRVELAPLAPVQDASRCVQSEAAALAVAAPSDLPRIHFQKGYCALAEAVAGGGKSDFLAAAAEFDKAIEAWPALAASSAKNGTAPEPVSSGLRVLAQVARLRAGLDAAGREQAARELSLAISPPHCASAVMTAGLCNSATAAGRVWLGWIALQRNDLYEASTDLAGSGSPWANWVAGKTAFRDRQYQEATRRYADAIAVWKNGPPDSLIARLAPQPELAKALVDLGGTQLLSGDPAASITTLDSAIQANPGLPRAYFLRACARERLGETAKALADYGLASRTALATSSGLASGEAHLYRGIADYRRGDYTQAEDEFSTALNFQIPPDLAPDAAAWRHMAAVAAGSCGASRELLERSLAAVSPYFPKEEARRLAASCPLTGGASVSGLSLR